MKMKHHITSENDLMHSKPLTGEDKREAVTRALSGFKNGRQHWPEEGLNDKDLEEAIRFSLGIYGGSGSRDSLKITYEGAGLKIWASWKTINTYEQKPIFEGKQTIAMARHVFNIPNPDDKQMSLF